MVKVVIETFHDPQQVTWKIKIGTTNVATGRANGNPYEINVDLDAGTEYKFVIIDNNTVKDTFYELWRGGDVLIDGDDFGRRDIKMFRV